ncbi:hypothetical protein RSAG8_03131, partial [Rhizoctonia solani AG-8 WAC10335]
MPPKFDPNDPAVAELISQFQSIGLSSSKATEAARGAKTAASLKELILAHGLESKGLDEKQGTLVASLAVQGAKLGETEKTYIVNAIVDHRLKSGEQLAAAIKYLSTHPPPIDDAEFDKECGVGIELSLGDIAQRVNAYMTSKAPAGWPALSSAIGDLKSTDLRWATPLDVKNAVEKAFTDMFGSKGEAKAKAVKEAKKPADTAAASTSKGESTPASSAVPERVVFEEGFLKALHKPGENPQIDTKLREQHLKTTSGQVFTRFPPEPNGFLHIGHSKAIFVNFGYAAYHNGKCYLRYDDTNPEAEEAIYFESILETIRWLGYEPYKITYSSDYFQELYDLAVKLIEVDGAYICNCTAEEIKANRGGEERGPRKACVHRTRPISESLAEFENMKNGKYKPGEAVLRMKQDLEDGNPQMWDLIAYRTLHAPHHRTGTKWCIYPTYDFTHCLVDSFENISHSLCTTEFILSRVSYEWLCDAVKVYKPRQSEYGRLNLQGTIMSKRKLLKLVTKGYVGGWDDPRLYTLVALRRRGVPPGAILSFVGNLGVSTATTNIELAKFEQTVRQYLENTVPRLLMVLRPLKVTIENLADDYVHFIDKPLHPKTDATGAVTELVCRLEDGSDGKPVPKPKAWIQWVAEHAPSGSPVVIDETRIFHSLFKSDNPAATDDFLADINPHSLDVIKGAMVEWVAEYAPSGSPVVIDETRIFHSLFKSDNPAATDDFLADINPHSLDVIKGAMVEVGFWPLAKRCMSDALKESRERTEKALKQQSVGEGVGSGAAGHSDTPMPTAEQLVGNEVVRFQGLRVAYFALDKEARVGCFAEPNYATPGRREGDKLVLNRIVSLKEDAGKKAA